MWLEVQCSRLGPVIWWYQRFVLCPSPHKFPHLNFKWPWPLTFRLGPYLKLLWLVQSVAPTGKVTAVTRVGGRKSQRVYTVSFERAWGSILSPSEVRGPELESTHQNGPSTHVYIICFVTLTWLLTVCRLMCSYRLMQRPVSSDTALSLSLKLLKSPLPLTDCVEKLQELLVY